MADLGGKEQFLGSVRSLDSDEQNESARAAPSEPDLASRDEIQDIEQKECHLNRDAMLDLEKGSASEINPTRTTGLNELARELPSPSPYTNVNSMNLVHWNGDQDPDNPQNWPRSKKWVAIMIGKFVAL